MQMMSGGRKVAIGKGGAILQNNALAMSFVRALHCWSGLQTFAWSKLPTLAGKNHSACIINQTVKQGAAWEQG